MKKPRLLCRLYPASLTAKVCGASSTAWRWVICGVACIRLWVTVPRLRCRVSGALDVAAWAAGRRLGQGFGAG